MPLVGAHEADVGFVSPEGTVCRFEAVDDVVKTSTEIFEV